MSTFTVRSKDFKEALNKLAPIVGDNSQNLNDNCIFLENHPNNILAINVTNVNEFGTIDIVCSGNDFSNNGSNAFPIADFKRFKSIIDTIPDTDDVIVEGTPKGNLTIDYGTRCGKPITVTAMTSQFLSKPGMVNCDNITLETNILKDALQEAASIVQHDDVTIASCMFVTIAGNDVKMISFDNSFGRVYKSESQTKYNNSKVQFLLRVKKLNKIFKMFNNADDIEINITKDFIEILQGTKTNASALDDIRYYIRRINVAFPTAFDQLFDVKSIEWATLNVDDTLNSLKRSLAIEDNDLTTEIVTVNIKGSDVTIHKNSQYGDMTDTISSSTPVSVEVTDQFKAKTLLEIVNNFKKDNISTFTIGKPILNVSTTNSNGHFLLSQDGFNSPSQFVLLGQGKTTP